MVKRKLSSEYEIFRNEVTWVEYALWWVGRIALLYVLVTATKEARGESLILQLSVEFALAFILPLLHLLPRNVFLARISYRVQDIIVLMLVTTAVFGQFKGFYSNVEWYDAYLHIIGCFVFVFVGYELIMALKRDKMPLAPVVAAMCGFGFSFFVAVSWEIFEFVCDTVMAGSNSQNWSNINSEQLLALLPPIDPQRYALLDTMTDLMAGTIGSLLGGTAIFPYVLLMNKRAAKLTLIKTKAHETKNNKEEEKQVG